MKILFLNSIPIEVYGGVEHWIGEVARGLIDRDHSVYVAGRADSLFLERTRRRVPEATTFGLQISGDFDPVTINRLKGLIGSHRIDVVVANFNKDIRLGGLAARWIGGVALVWRAGLDLTGSGWVHRALTPRLLDAVITPSVSLKEEIAAHGYITPERINAIPTGLQELPDRPDRSRAARLLREKYSLPADSIISVTSGRFVDQKGHRILIEAAARMVKQAENLHFLLLGDGPLQAELEALAEQYSVRERFLFAGLLENFDLELLGADIMVHPALWEPFGIVLVEGMRAGLPVVASRVGGIPEVVGEGVTATLVEPGQCRELTDAVCGLLSNPGTLHKMGDAGRQRWRERFSYEAMIDSVESVLSQVIAEKRRRELA